MSGIWERVFGRSRERGSARSAKERLQLVLFHDRINLPPEKLAEMKREIVAVISKYLDVASNDVDIALEQRDGQRNVMRAEIPFSKSVENDGPDEAIEQLESISSDSPDTRKHLMDEDDIITADDLTDDSAPLLDEDETLPS